MTGIRPRKTVVIILFFASTVFFLPKGVLVAGDYGKTLYTPADVQRLSPPDLPCGIRAMTGNDSGLFLLGKCGGVIQWQPFLKTHSVIVLEGQSEDVSEIAVDDDRIAVLDGRRRVIRTYNREGSFLSEYHYTGETHFQGIALVPKGVIASSFFDGHLLYLYREDPTQPVPIIENPRYWPESIPRFRAFSDVHFVDGEVFAVDLLDYSIYVVDPQSTSVSKIEKEPHPWWRKLEKPSGFNEDLNTHYTGEILAVSSAVKNGNAYILWIDRSLQRGLATPGDGYMELAVGKLTDKDWRTVVRLEDHERFGGCRHLSIVGESIFFLTMQGHVYAIELADR